MLCTELLEPETLAEACSMLDRYQGEAKVIAGGHGLLPLLKHRAIAPRYLVNIKDLPGLDYLVEEDDGLRIGALTTHRAIELDPTVISRFPILSELERVLGCVQTRNWATIGGNLCEATPADDPPPAFIALGATVKVVGTKGDRQIPMDQFIIGYRQTALKADEILVEIQVPNPGAHTGSSYHKERVRVADSPIASAAVAVSLDDDLETIVAARVVLQAVGPTPIIATTAERMLVGQKVEDALVRAVALAASEEARPISDMYGSADYKREMVKVATQQVINQAIARARH